MTSATPGRFSKAPVSTEPRLPVMPMAVRCAPGIACAWSPRLSTVSTTRRTSSAEAAESMTMSIRWYHVSHARLCQTGGRGTSDEATWSPGSGSDSGCFCRLRLQHQAEGRFHHLCPLQVRGEGTVLQLDVVGGGDRSSQ